VKMLDENKKLRDAINSYEGKIEHQNRVIEELLIKNLQMEKDRVTFENVKKAFQKESSELHSELDETRAKLSSSEDTLEKMKKEKLNFETVFEMLENEKSELLKEFDALRFKLNSSERENHASILRIQELTNHIEVLEHEKHEEINKNHMLTKENSKKLLELEDTIQVMYDSQHKPKYKRSYSKHESSPEVINKGIGSFRYEDSPKCYSSGDEEHNEPPKERKTYESLEFMMLEENTYDEDLKQYQAISPVIQMRTHKPTSSLFVSSSIKHIEEGEQIEKNPDELSEEKSSKKPVNETNSLKEKLRDCRACCSIM